MNMFAIAFSILVSFNSGQTLDTFVFPTTFLNAVSHQIVAANESHVYVLNSESEIAILDMHGNQIKHVGGQGEGPGEFLFPRAVFADDEHFYVVDTGAVTTFVNQFSTTGSFVKKVPFPRKAFFPEVLKIKTGWLLGDFYSQESGQNEAEIVIYDQELVEVGSLLKAKALQRGWTVSENCVIKYNPAAQSVLWALDNRDERLFTVLPESGVIQIWDTGEQKVIATFASDLKPIPFDQEWGKEQLREMQKREQACTVQANFPLVFPPIDQIRVAANNEVIIVGSKSFQGSKRQVVTFDRDGQPITSSFALKDQKHFLTSNSQYFFFRTYDSEADEFGIERRARKSHQN
jgi:hypothetical protein